MVMKNDGRERPTPEIASILRAMAKARRKKVSDLAREFGRRLRALREERKLTQRELAERLGAAVPQISRYEAGVSLPNAETLAAMGKTLRVDLDTLLLGEEGSKATDDVLIKDVRLIERVQEIEKLDRRYRDTAVAMLEALIVQGHQDSIKAKLSGPRR
jgi:transcriptional regulator with XRE-family HTH domain